MSLNDSLAVVPYRNHTVVRPQRGARRCAITSVRAPNASGWIGLRGFVLAGSLFAVLLAGGSVALLLLGGAVIDNFVAASCRSLLPRLDAQWLIESAR